MLKINCKITEPPATNKRLHALHATAPWPLKLSSPQSCHLCLLALCNRGSWCPLKTPPALNNNAFHCHPPQHSHLSPATPRQQHQRAQLPDNITALCLSIYRCKRRVHKSVFGVSSGVLTILVLFCSFYRYRAGARIEPKEHSFMYAYGFSLPA